MDGTEKLPQRIFQPAVAAQEAGLPLRPFAFATAAWMRYTLGGTEDGQPYALRDPRETEIRAALATVARDSAAISSALMDLPGFVPTALRNDPEWCRLTAQILSTILSQNMAAAIRQEAGI